MSVRITGLLKKLDWTLWGIFAARNTLDRTTIVCDTKLIIKHNNV